MVNGANPDKKALTSVAIKCGIGVARSGFT